MKRLIALGVSLVLSAELAALTLHDRRLVFWAAGAAVLFALISVRQFLGRDFEPPSSTIPNASRGIAAQLVVADSDTDSPVGINPGRLGPAFAPNAGAAIRDCDRTKAGQGSGGVRCHWANTFRHGAVGVGEPEQCCAHRCE